MTDWGQSESKTPSDVGARGYLHSYNCFLSIYRIPPVVVQAPIMSCVNLMLIQDLTVHTQLVPLCYNRRDLHLIFSIFPCRLYTPFSFLFWWLRCCSFTGLSWRSRHPDLDLWYDFLSWRTILFPHASLYSMVISTFPLIANNRHLPSLSSLLSSHLGRYLLDLYINPPMYLSLSLASSAHHLPSNLVSHP